MRRLPTAVPRYDVYEPTIGTRDDPRAAIFVAGERDVLFSRREKSWADKRRAGQLTFVSQQRIGVV